MDIQAVTDIFMWCTIINGGLFAFSVVMLVFARDFVYAVQSRFFPIPRDKFDVIIYAFIGVFKIIFICFNVVPWIALLVVAQS